MNPDEWAALPVARYLRPEEQVVPFRPRPELDELLHWCAGPEHAGVRLVTGDGGAGKTRLALRLGEVLAASGWQQLWVPRGSERDAVADAREVGQPCVLMVDYAETRNDLAGLAGDVATAGSGPDVRVVLLARSAGEWWQHLLASAEERAAALLDAAAPIMLGPVRAEGGSQEVFDEALTAFADHLGVVRPDARLTLTDTAVMLVVHAEALLAVLNQIRIGDIFEQPRTSQDVLTGVLGHEARYWHKSAAARGLALDPSVERLAVAVGCLIGAESEAAASQLLSHVPDLADSAERRGQVARWLHDLYPGPQVPGDAMNENWIGPLRPDRLAEQLVVAELSERTALLPSLLADLSDYRKLRTLTILARAALNDTHAVSMLRGTLDAGLEHLAVPALEVAVETNPVIADLINDALNAQPVSGQTLEDIAEALPFPTIALAKTAMTVLQRLANQSATESGQRAGRLMDLSNHLWGLGRREEALAVIEEAVGIYRRLAQEGTFLSGLATALNNKSNVLSGLQRWEEALAAIEEAIGIYQRLAEADPAEFLSGLAMALNNQSVRLKDIERWEEALVAVEEAIGIYHRLTGADAAESLPGLASALDNQSVCLSALGWEEEALAPIEEAVAIRRMLAQARPDAFQPDLASSLNNQANRLSVLDRWEEALAAIEEAVAIRRKLAQIHPDTFLSGLAISLNNESRCLRGLGRSEEALVAAEEAIGIYRRLAQALPESFLPELAVTLTNRSIYFADTGRSEEGLAPIEEAIGIYRRLAHDHPDAFRIRLAQALSNFAVSLSELARNREADEARREAIALLERP